MFKELQNKCQRATVDDLRLMIASAGMPPDAQQAAEIELEILSGMSSVDSEDYRSRATYVCYLSHLPWKGKTEDSLNFQKVESYLDDRYPATGEVKEKLKQFLTMKMSDNGRKARLLVVDDEKIALQSLGRALRKEGYDVDTAGSGGEAIEKLAGSEFDVVITDLIMGDIDGYAVLEETIDKYPDTRLIMITGYATVDTAVQALRRGAFHYIEKPLRLDEVRAAVRDALGDAFVTAKKTGLCIAGALTPDDEFDFARMIAEALGRNFTRISLSEMNSDSDIRGQSRLNKDATPGCVIDAFCRVGVSNPVVLMENFDRIAPDMKDIVRGVLTEVLDSVRNRNFKDQYINLAFDSSSALFITAVRSIESVDSVLNDFLQIIEL